MDLWMDKRIDGFMYELTTKSIMEKNKKLYKGKM